MGTRYYLHRNACECCGRADRPLFIGKSSAGWVFMLNRYDDHLQSLEDWIRLWMQDGVVIKDEYGNVKPWPELLQRIVMPGGVDGLQHNDPNRRHIAHIFDTYDLCYGEEEWS